MHSGVKREFSETLDAHKALLRGAEHAVSLTVDTALQQQEIYTHTQSPFI